MMKDGYWLRYGRTGIEAEVELPWGQEHESILREPATLRELRVPAEVYAQFSRFTPIRDRREFILFAIRSAPLMRVRAYNVYTSFNFASASTVQPYRAIKQFSDRHFGPAMLLNIVNFIGGQGVAVRVFPHELDRLLKGRRKKKPV